MSTYPASPTSSFAADFLLGRINYERSTCMPYESRFFKLDRVRELLSRLGSPQTMLPVVHIAGSKGKGSVAAMMSALFTAAGLRTGLFTSPHLARLEERLVVNGRCCPPAEFARLVRDVRPSVEQMDGAVAHPWERPTFFEIITAMAFKYFHDAHVEVAVFETGLGGRLDATNVCVPRVTVITSISRDHTKQLGERLGDIAAEKAGIIKPQTPVIAGRLPAEAQEVVERVCEQQSAPLLQLGRHFGYRLMEIGPQGTQFEYRGPHSQQGVTLTTPLIGDHQAANGAIALAAVRQWMQGQAADEPDFAALARVGWSEVACPARVEIMRRDPPVVLDAAHNEASIGALIDSLQRCFPGRRWTVIFGTSADKEIPAMLSRLLTWCDRLILTRYQENPRGAEIGRLQQVATEVAAGRRVTIEVAATPAQAWDFADRTIAPDAGVCITGSFFLAAEVRDSIADSAKPPPTSQQG